MLESVGNANNYWPARYNSTLSWIEDENCKFKSKSDNYSVHLFWCELSYGVINPWMNFFSWLFSTFSIFLQNHIWSITVKCMSEYWVIIINFIIVMSQGQQTIRILSKSVHPICFVVKLFMNYCAFPSFRLAVDR